MQIEWNSIVMDVAGEVRGGMDIEAAIREVAADYDVNEATLRSRVARAYPEGVPGEIDMAAKVQAEIERHCKRFGIALDNTVGPITVKDGTRYTAICRTPKNRVIAIDHATAKAWELGAGWFTNATLKYANV